MSCHDTAKRAISFIISAVLLFTPALSLTGCHTSPQAPKPGAVVKAYFDALKGQDLDKASAYVGSTTADVAGGFYFDLMSPSEPVIYKAIMAKNELHISDSSVSGDQAVVSCSVKAVDMKKILNDMFYNQYPIWTEQEKSGQMDDTEFTQARNKYVLDSIQKSDAPTTTISFNVQLTKQNNTWMITQNDELENAETGNYPDAETEFSKLIRGAAGK